MNVGGTYALLMSRFCGEFFSKTVLLGWCEKKTRFIMV